MFELPDWFQEFRPHQLVAVSQIISAYKNGAKVVFLDAPTGSGKTLIAEAVRQTLAYGRSDYRTLYICVTKTLQDQFLRDYEYAKVLKGRSNYSTEVDPYNAGLTTEDCMGTECTFCPNLCPYKQAKSLAVSAPVSVLNLAYALNEFKVKRSKFRDAQFKIVDECDVVENVLLSQSSIYISDRMARKLGLKPPEKKTVSSTWLKWATEARMRVEYFVDQMSDVHGDDIESIRKRRWNRRVENLYVKLRRLERDLIASEEAGEQSWVYTGYGQGNIEFKPINVDVFGREDLFQAMPEREEIIPSGMKTIRKYLPYSEYVAEFGEPEDDVLACCVNCHRPLTDEVSLERGYGPDCWKMYGNDKPEEPVYRYEYEISVPEQKIIHPPTDVNGRWLLMSGSIISADVLANEIGLIPNEWANVQVDYSFDPERRPIVIDPVGSMKRAQIEVTTPKMVMRILDILRKHDGERVLLHTHSYKLAGEIVGYLNGMPEVQSREVVTYTNASERESALSRYTNEHNKNAVMIASSMDRGVDLPYDMCRVQVICKAPFPYLGDKQVSAKTYGTRGGQMWYATQTVRAIVQMTGRGMRHADDEVVTYILDDDVRRLIRQNRRLFPKWWLDALVTG